VEQPGTTTADSPPQPQDAISPAPSVQDTPSPQSAGFRSRGRARRRARFLRKARELAYRDLGGLVFNLHRFGQRNDELVLAKLTTLAQIDTELRAIEGALGERQPITVLREAGITACPRCAAIHSSEDGFCPSCGMAMGRHADLPIAGAAAPPSAVAAPPAAGSPAAAVGAAPAAATPQPASGAGQATPTPQPSAPPPSPGPAPSATPGAREPAPSAAGGRSPLPPSTDRPTEVIRPPVSGS
jgi:hypothetical protein